MDVVQIEKDLEDLIPGYIANLKTYVKDMTAQLSAAQFEPIARTAHNIKGSGGGYGFMKITEIGAQLEAAAKANNVDQAKVLLGQLDSYINNVKIEYV
ncbi:MAG: Hpt domain-containing protein [Leptospirales bacterium]|nr:Hpt domain-containing protein [Leptospirales bacterium]